MKNHIQWFLAAGLVLAASITQANDLRVANVRLVHTDKVNLTTDVKFDLSWSNSWRAAWDEGAVTITNWDAAWVFIKYRILEGADTNWHHARLASGGHRPPAGMTIAVGSNGGGTNVGAFVYRSANGYGGLNLSGVRLRWDYPSNGLTMTNPIDVSVHAIEMVYIPEGSFYVGDTLINADKSSFYEGGGSNLFRITNEAALMLTNEAGGLWGALDAWDTYTQTDPAGVLSNAFPKGYNAFYCMKYEVTQGQYTEYLNQLTETQAGNRYIPGGTNRLTLGGNWPNYTNAAPDRAMNYLAYYDAWAYADWAGLRPMSELEYTKTCRGPITALLPREYAWRGHSWSYTQTDSFYGTDGSGTETAVPSAGNYANCNMISDLGGPARVGIYATNNATRNNSGAGYYGVMELTGSVCEQAMSVRLAGRAFLGTHGDGILSSTGTANNGWPSDYGYRALRGGCYNMRSSITERICTVGGGNRYPFYGFRAVRTAP